MPDSKSSNYDAAEYLDTRRFGMCDECGQLRRMNAIFASHSADQIARLCDECRDARIERLAAMYRGE